MQTGCFVCPGQHRRSRPDRREPAKAAPGGRYAAWLDRGGYLYSDEGVSGAYGRARRPGLDALLKGVSRKEFDLVAAWSVCRLGRSLPDLVGMLSELRSRDIDLYLHLQALDTSTPSGRALFGMLSVFSEFERAMIRDRVMAGLERARAAGKRLGRPRTTPLKISRIRRGTGRGTRCARDSAAAEGEPGQGIPDSERRLATVDLR